MIRPCRANIVYLDNNGTTGLCKESKDATILWMDSRANPSTSSMISVKSKQLIHNTKQYILKHCKAPNYTVIFTSGASESNCLIIRSIVDTKKNPHIITSTVEHKSILDCCASLVDSGKATVTYIQPTPQGIILPEMIKKAITKSTVLISIMAANNEIGCINDIKTIGQLARKYKIPFHTDAVQLFGKTKMILPDLNVDALSMSFHKLHGPMGLGMLIIKNALISEYKLKGQISGTQQLQMRGGTENVPAIAGVIPCMEHVFKHRVSKNKKLMAQKHLIVSALRKEWPSDKELVILGPAYNSRQALPNTLMISIVKYDTFCNGKLKKYLDSKKIIISIGSACSTDSKESHVLKAIRASPRIIRGSVRISLSDNTTNKEIHTFIKHIIAGANKSF